MRHGGLSDHSSRQAHRWAHEKFVWDYFTRAYRNFRSAGSAEQRLPRDPCQGDGLGARSPTLNISQDTDTGDHCLPNAAPDNGLSDEPPAVLFAVEIFVW